MKYILAAIGGFAPILCTFAGGVALAISYLSVVPVQLDSTSSYSAVEYPSEIVRVDATSQDYQRFGAPPVVSEKATTRDGGVSEVDEMTTAAFAMPEEVPTLSAEHVAWCSSQYRSYRAEDKTYQPYRGGARMQCQ